MELSKGKLSLYSGLGGRKQRLKSGLFIVEGEKSIADTLGSFMMEAIVLREGFTPTMFDLSDLSRERIYFTDTKGMDKLSTLSTSSPVVAIYRLPTEALEKRGFTAEKSVKEEKELYLMLDGIQDPGNLGTIIRTAHWFGIRKIFASPDTVDLYNPKTIQSTMGSLAKVKVIYGDLLTIIKNNPEMPVYGLLLDGNDIYHAELKDYGFVVMGNEGKGISEELKKMVTKRLLIPPYNHLNHSESLNVAIATGITLAEFRSR